MQLGTQQGCVTLQRSQLLLELGCFCIAYGTSLLQCLNLCKAAIARLPNGGERVGADGELEAIQLQCHMQPWLLAGRCAVSIKCVFVITWQLNSIFRDYGSQLQLLALVSGSDMAMLTCSTVMELQSCKSMESGSRQEFKLLVT